MNCHANLVVVKKLSDGNVSLGSFATTRYSGQVTPLMLLFNAKRRIFSDDEFVY